MRIENCGSGSENRSRAASEGAVREQGEAAKKERRSTERAGESTKGAEGSVGRAE